MDAEFDKQAYTGIVGRLCRYTGDAATGLRIELAPGDVLAVTPEQIRAIFSELGSFNPLLEECLGARPTLGLVEGIKSDARARRDRRANRAPREALPRRYDYLVSPRLRQWLGQHAVTAFGRPLGDEAAVLIQAAFGGEGLLPMNIDRPADFPVADVVTSLHGLVGRTIIYEEGREFMAVEIRAVATTGEGSQVHISVRNRRLPGFATSFPDDFTAGGRADELPMGVGTVGSYMGIWAMITGPLAVERIIEVAASGIDRKTLLNICREMTRGKPSHAY